MTKRTPPKELQAIALSIRSLSMDAVQAANSGHPGMPLGMADVAAVLWSDFLKFDPSNPDWFDRDRFVLSGGHGSMLLYSLLHLYGYDLSLDEIRHFRQWHSKTPGHPEYGDTPGVETTTGPLGQGLANAVGFAIAESSLAARFNKKSYPLIDHYCYVMAGDGDLQEGISHEAASLAGHLRLGKLILLYDDNNITIDGEANLAFSEDVMKRFDAYGWHTQSIDGHNLDAIYDAISQAREEKDRPSIISCKTIIGFGSPHRSGTSKAHGEPLGVEEIRLTKKALGLPTDQTFYIVPEAPSFAKSVAKRGAEHQRAWQALYKNYRNKYKSLSEKLTKAIAGEIPNAALRIPAFESGGVQATRAASGAILHGLAPKIPALIGGSADLTPSNKTFPKSESAFSALHRQGRYIHYGVREHAMAAIMNGLALHGAVLPYAGTFFVFTDYMRPAMRMAALMKLQVIYVLTHDSIGLGEDGPTHQPIAQLAALRAMPNMRVLRPMDANETIEAWKMALKHKTGPSCLVLTRQKLPVFDRKALQLASAKKAERGAYILAKDVGASYLIIASGSEVEIALEAKRKLNALKHKVMLVSMMSMEVFEAQPESYKRRVLPRRIKNRVAIEAGSGFGWDRYLGDKGKFIGMNSFGASAPYQILYEEFGITAEAILNHFLADR